MIKLSNISALILGLILSSQVKSQAPDFSSKDFLKDGIGNIINLTTGTVYKDLGDGTVLNLNSGEIYKKIADGTIIKLETDINVPIKIK